MSASTHFPALNLDAWLESLQAMIEVVERDRTKYQAMREASRRRAMSTYGWESVLKSLTTRALVPVPKQHVE